MGWAELRAAPGGMSEGARFDAAAYRWLAMHARTAHCPGHVPSAFILPQPKACPRGAVTRLGLSSLTDGGWDVCDEAALRKQGCVAYLIGAGINIAFDIAFARRYPRCQVGSHSQPRPAPGRPTMPRPARTLSP